MEEREPLEAALVETAQQVDLLVCAEERGVVSQGWEERIEASVGQWEQSKGTLREGVLIAVHRRRFHQLLPLVLDLLEFGDPPLEVLPSSRLHLGPKVLTEGPIQFVMVIDHHILQLLLTGLHLRNDARQLLSCALPGEEGFGVGGSVDGFEAVD